MKKYSICLFLLSLVTFSSCQKSFMKALSSSFAKEYCSCRFVVGQTKSYCENYARQFIDSKYSENQSTKVVSAKTLGITSIVKYRSKQLGCGFIQ